MSMATSNLSATVNFIPTGETQAIYGPPLDLAVFADTSGTQYVVQRLTLPAAGTSVTLPVPSGWTRTTQVIIQNLDSSNYCVLALNATTGAPRVQLAPKGLFACSLGASVPSGTVAATPSSWTLATCNSAGVLASGTALDVYLYLAGT